MFRARHFVFLLTLEYKNNFVFVTLVCFLSFIKFSVYIFTLEKKGVLQQKQYGIFHFNGCVLFSRIYTEKATTVSSSMHTQSSLICRLRSSVHVPFATDLNVSVIEVYGKQSYNYINLI